MCTLKNITSYSKRAGYYLGTVDCTSKIHSSTLGSRVWGKGDCGPFESPLRRSTRDCCKVSKLKQKQKLCILCKAGLKYSHCSSLLENMHVSTGDVVKTLAFIVERNYAGTSILKVR